MILITYNDLITYYNNDLTYNDLITYYNNDNNLQ